jgi:squalene/oxidosqualene cyclase-like protein
LVAEIVNGDGQGGRSLRDAAMRSLGLACDNLGKRQSADGSWRGDYTGPTFLLPMYVALCHAAQSELSPERSKKMRAHLLGAQNADGSIGLYPGGPGSVFTSALGYAALRILGQPSQGTSMMRLRDWILAHGSPLASGSWGKFVLCTIGLHEYEGLHPIPPELWLLPYRLPIHPGRLWCHARQVYLPMAWLYGKRATGPVSGLIREIRDELYGEDYDQIKWRHHRNRVSPSDNYRPLTPEYRIASRILGVLETVLPRRLRERALRKVMEHIRYEDKSTSHIGIGPVNATLNTLVHHFSQPAGDEFARSMRALEYYLWVDGDELRMQAYNSSQLWDTSFALQALHAAGELPGGASDEDVLKRAYGYVCQNQILEDLADHDRFFRHRSRGGWPFSTLAHGWPITDCTSEGLKAALIGERLGLGAPIGHRRVHDAVELILSWQNTDGGWATYERTRGGRWLERLNPSQMFGDIMIDYSHVETTSACIQALADVRRWDSDHLAEAVGPAIRRGARFLADAQRQDGSFEGSWGVCFTYGTWFAVSGLIAAGVPLSSPVIRRAGEFLIGIQKPDGSWGEAPESCPSRAYVEHSNGQVVMTAWAVLTLCRAGHGESAATTAGVQFLLDRQLHDGGYPRESYAGVFSRTVMINYDNYRHYFPLWALAEWLRCAS